MLKSKSSPHSIRTVRVSSKIAKGVPSTVNASCVLAPTSLGQSRLLGRVCGRCSRPAAVGAGLGGRRLQEVDLAGCRLGDADLVKSTWCGRLTTGLVDLDLVDRGCGRLGLVDQDGRRPGRSTGTKTSGADLGAPTWGVADLVKSASGRRLGQSTSTYNFLSTFPEEVDADLVVSRSTKLPKRLSYVDVHDSRPGGSGEADLGGGIPRSTWADQVQSWARERLCCAASGGAGSRGADPGVAEPGGAESEGFGSRGAEPGGAEPRGAEFGGAVPGGAETAGVWLGVLSLRVRSLGVLSLGLLLLLEDLRVLLHDCLPGRSLSPCSSCASGARVSAGAGGTRGAAAAGPGGARTRGTGAAATGGVGGAGAGDPKEPGASGAGVTGAGSTGAGGAGARGAGAIGTGTGGAGAGGARGAGAVDPGAGSGGAGGTGAGGTLASPLLAPSPYAKQTGGLTERREPASRVASPVHTGRRVPRPRPPPVPSTHAMALRPSSVSLHVPLPAPPESSLPAVPHLESILARATNPTVSRLLATVVIDPSFESAGASALVAELVDFAATCCLDYATALVAESESASPLSVEGECALGTDVLEDRQETFECLSSAVPRFASMLLAPEGDPDASDIPTLRSYAEAITGTYVNAVPPSPANIVDGMWIFRVKRPPGSSPAFKARYVARDFSQRQGVNFFQTFSPTPKMTTLCVLLHVAAQRDYELHSLDFSTAFL
ncbi:unnamed protein product [Closterium sp. NIES-54]